MWDRCVGNVCEIKVKKAQLLESADDLCGSVGHCRAVKSEFDYVARTPADSPIVVAARSVARALGLPSRLTEGSTDSNVPIDLGIPAITIDGGGRGTGSHSLDETFDATDSWKGTQWVALLALALSQP